jgi:hypothetical protein
MNNTHTAEYTALENNMVRDEIDLQKEIDSAEWISDKTNGQYQWPWKLLSAYWGIRSKKALADAENLSKSELRMRGR